MTTLPIETRTAAWKPPTLTKALARTVAKRLDKHWAQTGVKGLGSISHAIAQGVLGGMSQMRDRVDNQAAVKKWSEALSKDDLHKMFRMIEEIKNGKGREQYRMTDDALSGLRAASDLLPVEKAAASYLDMFFKEKRIPSKVFEVTDSQGITHSIPKITWTTMTKRVWSSKLGKLVLFKCLRCNVSHDYNYEMNDNDVADQLRLIYQIMRFQRNNKWWWEL